MDSPGPLTAEFARTKWRIALNVTITSTRQRRNRSAWAHFPWSGSPDRTRPRPRMVEPVYGRLGWHAVSQRIESDW